MRNIKTVIDGKTFEIEGGLQLAKNLYEKANIDKQTQKLLYQVKEDRKVSISPDESIILEDGTEFSTEDNSISTEEEIEVSIQFNEEKCRLSNNKTTIENLKRSDTQFDNSHIYACFKDEYIQIDEAIHKTILIRDDDKFITISVEWINENGAIDIEQCTRNNRQAPNIRGGKYLIRLDSAQYEVNQPHLSCKEILALASKSDSQYDLYQKHLDGKRVQIKPDQDVNFCKEGVERFETIPVEVQQG